MRSDKFCLWIDEEYKSKDEKTKGKTMTRKVAGYCVSMEKLLDDFVDKQFKDSDATSMEEVLKILDKTSKEVRQIAKAAAEGNFRIIRHKEK